MSIDQILTIFLTLFGLIGFELAGRKIWWAWYINIANQVLWFAFSVITGYYAFIIGTFFYFYQFSRNAYRWTKEHFDSKKPNRDNYCYGRWDGENWIANACTVPRVPHAPHDIPEEDRGWNFNRVAMPDIEIYDGDLPPEVVPDLETVNHPLVPKFEPEDTTRGVLCTGRPRHPDCEMPTLAHKPHFVIPKE